MMGNCQLKERHTRHEGRRGKQFVTNLNVSSYRGDRKIRNNNDSMRINRDKNGHGSNQSNNCEIQIIYK